jgi:NAD(P)H-hydrate epimerase
VQPVVTPDEMAEADQRAIAAGTPVEILMDRAGRAVAWAIRRSIGPYGARVVVVCGKGNNGGDGLVAARVLRGWGVRVDVFELERGIDERSLARAIGRAQVVIDAMFGTGFRGALRDDARRVVDALGRFTGLVVAVDIPSGVDGLTGTTEGAVRADETVCFGARKSGLLFEPGRWHAGRITVVDIGIDIGQPSLGLVERDDVHGRLPQRAPDTNKWQSGLLVVGGSDGMTGAPSLVSHAAMRTGAGIVWCAVPGRDAAQRASGTEVIMKALPASDDGALAGLGDLLDHIDRFRAVAVGPGLGTSDVTRATVRELVAKAAKPMVVDADGLNAFAGDAAALQQRPAPTVLTPHDGEYSRLAGAPVGADRIAAARQLASASECVVLLKGPTTVVAVPDGRAALCTNGGPALASAGSGDVLTGIIGALLASGVDAFGAAISGAFLHARAADVAGHAGLVAGDLVAALPRTLEELET